MTVLIDCEESQEVCKAFRRRGHDAYSCDLQDCSGGHPEWHIKGDAIKALYSRKWDLVIAHPPCTYLANSGVGSLVSKKPKDGFEYNDQVKLYVNYPRYNELQTGCTFFNHFILYGKLGNRIAIENPIPHKYAKELLTANYRQIIQPYYFGHTESKATCIWLFGLPELKRTNDVKHIWRNLPKKEAQRIHYLSPGPERQKERSKTFSGIADAMAEQWSNIKEPKQADLFSELKSA